jgi:hypothetical protein
MPSINYPFPDPKNEEERAANRAASDEYDRLENEAADFIDWGQELAHLPTPVTLPTVYTVSLLREDDVNYRAYLVTVAHQCADLWSVTHSGGTCHLDAAENWTTPGDDTASNDRARENPSLLFPYEDALRMAANAAYTVTVNGISARDLLLRRLGGGA